MVMFKVMMSMMIVVTMVVMMMMMTMVVMVVMVAMVVMVVTVIRDCGQSFVSVAGSLITRTTLFFLLLHCVFLNILYTHTAK